MWPGQHRSGASLAVVLLPLGEGPHSMIIFPVLINYKRSKGHCVTVSIPLLRDVIYRGPELGSALCLVFYREDVSFDLLDLAGVGLSPDPHDRLALGGLLRTGPFRLCAQIV